MTTTNPIPPPSLPTMGSEFDHLRSGASTAEVTREFEALFLAYLLKVMRESVGSSGLMQGLPGGETYMQLMDQEVARSLARQGGLGLADLLQRHLDGSFPGEGSSEEARAPSPAPRRDGVYLQGRVTSEMGWRRDPIDGELLFHRGVDVAAPEGTPVTALDGGRVVFAGRQGGYGKTVVVESDDGTRIRYAHLSGFDVLSGSRVRRGRLLGTVGSTGRATGPHLHVEISRGDLPIDPKGAIEAYRRAAGVSGE